MNEEYVSKEEYASLFITLTRAQITNDISIGQKVLDIAAGSAYFSIQLAEKNPESNITAIDIYTGSVREAKKNIAEAGLMDQIKALQMDATNLDFPDNSFDTVVNYLGLEDIHMTKGEKGVEQTFYEVFRVLKSGGSFYFVAMPPDLMDSMAQRIEVDVFSWICDAKWLESDQYMGFAEAAGFRFKDKQDYHTGKKLTVEQAKEEIAYACLNVPRNYGVEAKGFQETWEKYGALIEEHGMGHYSKTVLFEFMKPYVGRV